MKIKNLIQFTLTKAQYYPEVFPKKQIVLHHTVSGPNAKNVISGWGYTPVRVATAFVSDGDGIIYQCFSSAHWAHHLGTHNRNNTQLNQQSIGIEICNWGALIEKGGRYFSTFNREVPKEEVIDYGMQWRGHRYFHKYKDEQLESLKTLLEYLCEKYTIPNTYQPDMWKLNTQAMNGTPGIWTHVSFRADKSDCHPQLSLIKMLKSFSEVRL